MTHAEFEEEVARATGESLCTIRQRGFSLVDVHNRPPQVVDWDALDAKRTAVLPQRSRSCRALLAGGKR